jgi:hypothetical protein
MSPSKTRFVTTVRTDFMADERTYLAAWADVNGLEVAIKPAGAGQAKEMAFVGYGEGIASWAIYRADGYLWLCRVEDRAGQDCEGLKVAVESVEEALAMITIDTEA